MNNTVKCFWMPNQDRLLGRTMLKDASTTCLTCYWHTDLKQVQSKAIAPELWGAAPKSPEVYHLQSCKGKTASNVDLRSGYILHSTANYNYKGNGIFYRMEVLLTQTIETDTPGFYSFCKQWLWKRYFIFWQYWWIEQQSGRGNHWHHEWNKQMKHPSSKPYIWCSLETGI